VGWGGVGAMNLYRVNCKPRPISSACYLINAAEEHIFQPIYILLGKCVPQLQYMVSGGFAPGSEMEMVRLS